jgi:hypothetical protein
MDMLTTTARQLLLFGHTLAFAFAIAAVFREDVALLRARRVDAAKLEAAGRTIARLLGLLWLTGAALIVLDIGLDWSALAHKPKLAAKLTVVSLLTANGLLLHWVVFPLLTKPQRSPGFASAACAVVGAVSSVTWLFASFVGVARLIAPAMTYGGFLGLYGLSLAAGLVVSLAFVRPHIERLMLPRPERWRQRSKRRLLSTFGPATSLLLDEGIRKAHVGQPAAYAQALAARVPADMDDARAVFLRRVAPVVESRF